jgi:aspartate racemase
MKTIGMLGGMSWESTVSYYQAVNEGIKEKLGSLNSAKVCLYSINFEEMEILQHKGDWEGCADILCRAARSVEAGGADFLMICTNTMHKVAPRVEAAVSIPLLHIADAAAEKLQHQGFNKVGLLGTKFTMEQDFYKERLRDKYGIAVIIPEESDREQIHNVIYGELCLGVIRDESRAFFLRIIDDLRNRGAQAVILGCTEIPLLVKQDHTKVPLIDTAVTHAQKAVEMALL